MKKIIINIAALILLISAAHNSLQAQSWSRNGNAGTDPATEFIGTNDNKGFKIKTNNQARITVASGGKVGIGTGSPTYTLHVNGDGYVKNDFTVDNSVHVGNGLFTGSSVGILTGAPQARLHINDDESLVSITGQPRLQIGKTDKNNIIFDNNEIQARNNGIAGPLFAQYWGGDFLMCKNGGNILMGNLNPSDAHGKLTIQAEPNIPTVAMFGKGTAGISIAHNYPGIYFNSYSDFLFTRAMSYGYGAQMYMNRETGMLTYRVTDSAAAEGDVPDFNERFFIDKRGNIKIAYSFYTGGPDEGFMLNNTGSNNNRWNIYTTNSNGDLSLFSNGLAKGNFSQVTGAYTQTSDRRLKKDIAPMQPTLESVMKLAPSTYKYNNNNPENRASIGFIAQDVEKIFPELVYKIGEDRQTYSLDYSGFGVIAIKAIQELNSTVAEKNERITTLENKMERLEKQIASIQNAMSKCCAFYQTSAEKVADVSNDKATSMQANPNPFSNKTTVNCSIPSSATKAEIKILSMDAKELKSILVSQRGNTSIEITSDGLSNGTYLYELIIDGKISATKKLTVLK